MIVRYFFLSLIFASTHVYAAPFNSCPSKAFLFQGSPTIVYGVNLASGSDTILQSDVGTPAGESSQGNVNGVGFNDFIAEDGTSQRYLYGFNTTHLKFVRLDSDFKQTQLPVTNQPEGSFYVGDVFDRHYYFYRKNKGLYKINLDETADNYLEVITITTKASQNFTDFAFHPRNGKLYGIDNGTGILYEVDKENGTTLNLGFTGEKGTFGAGYFDVNGYFYVSRNQDGKIYRVDLSQIDLPDDTRAYAAVEFAAGPLSGQNDGARCANAPLIDINEGGSMIDFGDAPDTYGTSLASNGARHEIIANNPYLGNIPADGETDSYMGILSDDISNVDDEDGVAFVTGLARGLDNTVLVTASTTGYLQAWFDWNRDGDFDDEGEQTVIDKQISQGDSTLIVRVPIDADIGASWARFRFGSQTGINYSGGATDGEVEDYAIEISDVGVSYSYYPANNAWVTLAYEDQWPVEGDYDMNDVVFHYRTVSVIKDNKLQRVDIYGQLVAIGAHYHNGFALRIPGVQTEVVDTEKLRFRHTRLDKNGDATTTDKASPIESNNGELIAIITNDVWDLVSTDCSFYRTDSNCKDHIQFAFELSLPFTELQSKSNISTLYDPFIFATENRYHGGTFPAPPGRELEVHLADVSPTEQANAEYFGKQQDTSNLERKRFYKNANNLPWAMEIATEWKYPTSGTDLLKAYPYFEGYVTSNKLENLDWYDVDKRVDANVYQY